MPGVRILAMLIGAALAGGCSGLLLGPEPPPVRTYLLAPDLPPASLSPRGPTIAVSRPEAAAGYGSPRMAYVERDYRLDYFADNAWVDTPANMLHPLLAKALRATGRFRAVAEDVRGLEMDLRLDTLIVELRQDFRRRPSRGSILLRAHLVDPERRRLVATRSFQGDARAPSDDPYGGVVAINRALRQLLEELAAFAADGAAGL
jgi:cholesterol transport system auxiliary component